MININYHKKTWEALKVNFLALKRSMEVKALTILSSNVLEEISTIKPEMKSKESNNIPTFKKIKTFNGLIRKKDYSKPPWKKPFNKPKLRKRDSLVKVKQNINKMSVNFPATTKNS